MSPAWSPIALLKELEARGAHPAVTVFTETGAVTIDSAKLADEAGRFARALRRAGFGDGKRVALCGPANGDWIAVALGVLTSGAVLVPIDDLAEAAAFEASLDTCKVRLVVASARRLEAAGGAISRRALPSLPLDAVASPGGGWRDLPPGDAALPTPGPETPLMLSWTSGTTGSPKVFPLVLANIANNIDAICGLHVVGANDRVLLPLPLHHAYPFVVGVLSILIVGPTLVLPAGSTGPLIMRALREGQASAVIGVPRLYDAIIVALDSRFAARGLLPRLAWRGALAGAVRLQKSGLRVGRLLFLPVRRGLAPRLRLLVSGGARLDEATEERLVAIGWTVLCGYGLAETASMFTGNVPGNARLGSAGRPLGDGRVRIADPDPQGVGEVQLRGSAVTTGYLDNPAANAASFTSDGWFRTGDLGRLNADGFLFVTGRLKETIVLGGGKKVDPEPLERIYAMAPGIAELGLLEADGALVALVRPDPVVMRARGVTNLRDGVHVALTMIAQDLPSWQRLSGFALTDAPLPRTRLGKLRLFLLPRLYAAALAGRGRRPGQPLSDQDRALLGNPLAQGVWELLRERFLDRATDLDVNLALDLKLDSFGWMELGVALQQRFGIELGQNEIARIATIRDLLQRAAAGDSAAAMEPPAIAVDLDRWLAPTGPLLTLAGTILFAVNWLDMRTGFGLRVEGLGRLPRSGPFVITPNHVSDLDALAIAAALPLRRLRHLYWAGDIFRLFYNAPARLFCRTVHLYPVDETHPLSALAAAERVLARGGTQVWFPQGWRSPDGKCQRFLPSIGQLLLRSRVPAVPAWIAGAFEALPRHRRVPRLLPVSLVFGNPVTADQLSTEGKGQSEEERIADGLRRRVLALAARENCK